MPLQPSIKQEDTEHSLVSCPVPVQSSTEQEETPLLPSRLQSATFINSLEALVVEIDSEIDALTDQIDSLEAASSYQKVADDPSSIKQEDSLEDSPNSLGSYELPFVESINLEALREKAREKEAENEALMNKINSIPDPPSHLPDLQSSKSKRHQAEAECQKTAVLC